MADESKPPQGMTEEQLQTWIDDKLGKTVNNMLTARLETFQKKFAAQLQGTITESLSKTLEEKLAALPQGRREKEEKPDDEGGKRDKEGRREREKDPELATLKQQLAAMAAKQAETEARERALRERSRTQNVREQVRSFLGRAGIDGERFEAAYALLDHSGKLVKAEDPDSEEVFFRASPSSDPVMLETGLLEWLKSEQAKIFMPATRVGGSGSRPGTMQNNGKPLTADQIRANVAAELDRELQR